MQKLTANFFEKDQKTLVEKERLLYLHTKALNIRFMGYKEFKEYNELLEKYPEYVQYGRALQGNSNTATRSGSGT